MALIIAVRLPRHFGLGAIHPARPTTSPSRGARRPRRASVDERSVYVQSGFVLQPTASCRPELRRRKELAGSRIRRIRFWPGVSDFVSWIFFSTLIDRRVGRCRQLLFLCRRVTFQLVITVDHAFLALVGITVKGEHRLCPVSDH